MAVQKIYYPIEEQLERIAEEVDGFVLEKPADQMNEEELLEAEAEASKYVEWVKDDSFIQAVPKKRTNGIRIYPI
jgi:hypothetical protein